MLEPEARKHYEYLTGIRVVPACLQSLEYDWMRASVDGLAIDGKRSSKSNAAKAVIERRPRQKKSPITITANCSISWP